MLVLSVRTVHTPVSINGICAYVGSGSSVGIFIGAVIGGGGGARICVGAGARLT